MSLFVLPPSASAPLPLPPEGQEPVAPGGVFVVPTSTWRFEEDIESLLAAIQAAPWAPLVIVEDTAELPRGLGAEAPWLFAHAANLVRVPPPARCSPELRPALLAGRGSVLTTRFEEAEIFLPVEVMVGAVWCAIGSRPVPDSQAFGRVAAKRWGDEIGDPLAAVLESGRADALLSRRFAKLRLPPPRQWAALSKLVAAVTLARQRGWSQAAVADFVGISARSLSIGCKSQLGCGWSRATAFGAWEGVVEQFLRCAREKQTR
jgi:hypothetical protein